MASWTNVVPAIKTSCPTRIRTLCDFPLLIGEILSRADLRLRRQVKHRARLRKIRAFFCIRRAPAAIRLKNQVQQPVEQFMSYRPKDRDESVLNLRL